MFFVAVATDYDGTLANEGRVDAATLHALERLRESGRMAILVTGRELPDLERVFPHLDLFTLVVAENGGLLYRPRSKEEIPLAPPPPAAFVTRLKEAGVEGLSVGRAIVATRVPHDRAVLDAIRDLGLDLQITYNKGAVMVLPAGVNKASGLAVALRELALSPLNVVGAGDAENDRAFLAVCGCAVAVANALPAVKEICDWTTQAARGAGVQEAIARLLAHDYRELPLTRTDDLHLGTGRDGKRHVLPWRGTWLMIAGGSGGGKTTFITAVIEQLRDRGLQTVVLDPEAEYEGIEGLTRLGESHLPPTAAQAMELLQLPDQSVALNLLAIPLADRPAFLAALMADAAELRRSTGRPHWMVLDEAHHLLPAAWQHAPYAMPRCDQGMILVTIEPRRLAPEALAEVEVVVAISDTADSVIAQMAEARGLPRPTLPAAKPRRGEAWLWRLGGPVETVVLPTSRARHQRHVRKYVEGHLAPGESFYFRGPDNLLNLRADNLQIFLQMAEGIDDATWMHHLRAGDYSRWFAANIKNPDLATEAQRIEREPGLGPEQSRAGIRTAIERRYVVSGGPLVSPPPSGT